MILVPSVTSWDSKVPPTSEEGVPSEAPPPGGRIRKDSFDKSRLYSAAEAALGGGRGGEAVMEEGEWSNSRGGREAGGEMDSAESWW